MLRKGGQTCRIGRRDWACGEDATAALRQRVGQQTVSCERKGTDRYGRVVAECWAEGENLNAWTVRSGWALAYRQYGGRRYDAEELMAQVGRRGVWGSDFEAPWDWRRLQRQRATPGFSRLLLTLEERFRNKIAKIVYFGPRPPSSLANIL